jgi:site-specific DNA-cytosine methylase
VKVLVACEMSGVVREAFASRGHDAWSIDLEDTMQPGQHIVGDVEDHLDKGWDLMVAFPPCTHLAVSGARYFPEKIADGRQQAALDFVRILLDADIPHIALENPVSIISTRIRKPDQYVQPWMFGHDAAKKTGLWLKNLPLLQPTQIIKKKLYANQTPSGQNKLGPSNPNRARDRGITYQGIADAMADQWGTI